MKNSNLKKNNINIFKNETLFYVVCKIFLKIGRIAYLFKLV